MQDQLDGHEMKVDKHTLSIKNALRFCSENANKLHKLEVLINQKCDQAVHDALEKRFNVFGNLEHMSMLRDVFLPRIEKFADQVDQLYQHNKD